MTICYEFDNSGDWRGQTTGKEDLEEKEKKWMEKLISALRRQETEMAAERKLNDIWQKLKFLQFNVDLIWLFI